jgi:hypothetical protein
MRSTTTVRCCGGSCKTAADTRAAVSVAVTVSAGEGSAVMGKSAALSLREREPGSERTRKAARHLFTAMA